MKYRPDIDGLRGIAVLLVVLYHLELFSVSGGFIGVDVFFVISGFLITSIVIGEINHKEFSILYFYERRVRRIFPALFSVLLVCTVIGFALLIPPDFEKYGRSLIATVFFVPNIFFASQKSYFSPDNDRHPLLHTWSLGVEEQFYLALPLLLLLLLKFSSRLRLILIGLAFIASLCWCFALVKVQPVSAFYLAPSRAWELLLGVFIAHLRPLPSRNRWILEVTALLGLCLIGGSAFLLSERILFPGPYGLLPTIGAGLVIYTGTCGNTITSRLLSCTPLVRIGLISYSLYLWHWPLLSFLTIAQDDKPGGSIRYALLLASIGLAWGSWRWIEQPFRSASKIYT
jgi:peptidoglycan/LPS O-acetylase OafA/YrhL